MHVHAFVLSASSDPHDALQCRFTCECPLGIRFIKLRHFLRAYISQDRCLEGFRVMTERFLDLVVYAFNHERVKHESQGANLGTDVLRPMVLRTNALVAVRVDVLADLLIRGLVQAPRYPDTSWLLCMATLQH
jgi:hypothetical protein